MKPLKLQSVKEAQQVDRDLLRQMLQQRKFGIKIKTGTAPDEVARILRVLATQIDDERNRLKSWD